MVEKIKIRNRRTTDMDWRHTPSFRAWKITLGDGLQTYLAVLDAAETNFQNFLPSVEKSLSAESPPITLKIYRKNSKSPNLRVITWNTYQWKELVVLSFVMCFLSPYLTPFLRYGILLSFWNGDFQVSRATFRRKVENDFSRSETRFPGAETGFYT